MFTLLHEQVTCTYYLAVRLPIQSIVTVQYSYKFLYIS